MKPAKKCIKWRFTQIPDRSGRTRTYIVSVNKAYASVFFSRRGRPDFVPNLSGCTTRVPSGHLRTLTGCGSRLYPDEIGTAPP